MSYAKMASILEKWVKTDHKVFDLWNVAIFEIPVERLPLFAADTVHYDDVMDLLSPSPVDFHYNESVMRNFDVFC